MAAAVSDDFAVLQFDDALRMLRHFHIVGDDHHGVAALVQLAEDRQHFLAGLGVQRAGRFVRQDNFAAVDQRARDADALLLAAGKLAGLVVFAPLQAQPRQQLRRSLPPLIAPGVGVDGRNFNVAQRAEIGHQVVTLEDKADMLAAQAGQFVRRQVGGVLAADVVVAAIRHIEAAHDVH